MSTTFIIYKNVQSCCSVYLFPAKEAGKKMLPEVSGPSGLTRTFFYEEIPQTLNDLNVLNGSKNPHKTTKFAEQVKGSCCKIQVRIKA